MPIWLIVIGAFAVGVGAVAALVAGATNLPGYLTRRRIEQRMRETGIEMADADASKATVVKMENEGPLPSFSKVKISCMVITSPSIPVISDTLVTLREPSLRRVCCTTS